MSSLLMAATHPPFVGAAQTGVLVDDHGAVGNGTTDDTTAIQAAINAAKAAATNLIFTAGKTYRFSRITFAEFDATVYGNGAWIKVTDSASTTSGGPNVSFTSCSNLLVDQLNMHGNRSVRGSVESFSGHLAMLNDCHDWVVQGCELTQGATDCLRISALSTSDFNTASDFGLVQNCLITNAGRLGIGLIEGHDIRITSNTFRDVAKSNAGFEGYAPGTAIDVEPNIGSPDNGSGFVTLNIEIDHNLMEDCWGGGASVAGPGPDRKYNSNVNIHHNEINRCGGKVLSHGTNRDTGVYVAIGSDVLVEDNTIVTSPTLDTASGAWGTIALSIDTTGPVYVRRNTITHVAGYEARGIHVNFINTYQERCPTCPGEVKDNIITTTPDTNTPVIYIDSSRVNWTQSGNQVI